MKLLHLTSPPSVRNVAPKLPTYLAANIRLTAHVGQEPGKPTASGYDDAAFVRAKAVEWMDAGKDVIFVANSYGGFVAQEAAQGLSREDRDAAGHKNAGALVRIVLLSSFLWTLGATVQDMVGAHIPVDTATKSADIEVRNFRPVSHISTLPPPPNPFHDESLSNDNGRKCSISTPFQLRWRARSSAVH